MNFELIKSLCANVHIAVTSFDQNVSILLGNNIHIGNKIILI